MDKITPFSAQHLEAACKVLADTDRGLTGSEIGYLLQDCNLEDVSPEMTKRKRLFNALVKAQNTHQVGNHLIMFINSALNPVSYARDKEKFAWRRSELNVVLSFSGFSVREDGKVIRSSVETTLKGARARAGALQAALEDRGTHDMRHTYATLRLSKGDSLAEVSKEMGHSTPDITYRTYYKWLPTESRSNIDDLDGFGERAQQNATYTQPETAKGSVIMTNPL